VGYNGHARLTDFGLALIVRGMNSATQGDEHTVAWTAPEILEGAGTITREVDVFAFGMVVTEVGPRALLPPVSEGSPDVRILRKVFTGRPPFSESTTPVINSNIMGAKRPARSQEGQELALTDSVWDMTIRCWHQDPAQRPTMTEVVGIVRKWLAFPLSPWNQHHDILQLQDGGYSEGWNRGYPSQGLHRKYSTLV